MIKDSEIQNIIDQKGYTDLYKSPKIIKLENNKYELLVEVNKLCGNKLPNTKFIWIESHSLNGNILSCVFKTGFSTSLNGWKYEISELLYFYQL